MSLWLDPQNNPTGPHIIFKFTLPLKPIRRQKITIPILNPLKDFILFLNMLNCDIYVLVEGSDENRSAVMRAVKYRTSFDFLNEVYKVTGEEDITVELVDIDELDVGKPAVIKVDIGIVYF